jgi:hypothetical protein
MDATRVLVAFGDACWEMTLPEVEAPSPRPPLNAHTGKRGSYLPDFWNGHWRRLWVRLLADADHCAGLTVVIRDLRVCFLWRC